MNAVTLTSSFPATVQPGIPKLGVKPDGWTRAPLGQFLREVRRPLRMTDDEQYRLVTVKRGRGGVVDRGRFLGRDVLVKSQFLIEPGDFLISKRQIVHGACGLVPDALGGSIVSNEYAVLNGTSEIDLRFLNYLANSIYFQQTCFHSSIGVHVEKMIFKLDRWLGFLFDIPPLPEQRKIAEILSTWDRAIETTEALLAIARTQKRALMQSLLTGKRRFPEFEGQAWQEVRLGDLGSTFTGLTGKTKDDFGEGLPYIPYLNIFQNSRIDTSRFDYVSVGHNERQNRVLFGDIFFTTSSETPDEVGMSSVLLDDIPDLFLNSFCFGFRLHDFETLRPRFARFFLRGQDFRRALHRLAQGATRYNLSKTHLLDLNLVLPPVEEQERIADVLETAQTEESDVAAQIKKLRTEKKALMQQLLTGKRRVVV